MIKRKHIIWFLIGIGFTVFLLRHIDRTSHRGTDFQVYYTTAQRFAEKGDIYGRPDETITPFKYSPMFAFLISPLSLFSLKRADAIFFTMSFISFVIVLIFFKKLLVKEESNFSQNTWLYVVPVLLSFRFILGVFDSGQVSFLMTALVVSAIYSFEKGNDLFGAALLALSMMFKYMSFIFIPYFLIKRRFKIVSYTLIFAAFYCLLPSLYVGLNKEVGYLTQWLPSISSTSLDKGSWTDYKNQSLYSFILRTFMKDSPYDPVMHSLSFWSFHNTLIVSIVLGVLIYVAMIFPRPEPSSRLDIIEYAMLFVGMALFNPNAWAFNYALIVVAYMVVVYYFLKNKLDYRALFLTACVFILTSIGSQSVVGRNLQYKFEVFSLVTIGAVIMVFTLYGLKYRKAVL